MIRAHFIVNFKSDLQLISTILRQTNIFNKVFSLLQNRWQMKKSNKKKRKEKVNEYVCAWLLVHICGVHKLDLSPLHQPIKCNDEEK